MTSQIFYSSLVNFNKLATGKSHFKYVPSFAVEAIFWNRMVLPGLADAAASFFKSEVIQKNTLFGDWLCQNTNIQGSSIPEINFLLITMYRFGLTDDTSFTQALKTQIVKNIGSLSFPDFGTLLHELILTDKPNFIPTSVQKDFIKSKLRIDRIYPQKLKHFFDNPIIRLKFCKHTLAQPDISVDIEAAIKFYETMVRSSEQGSEQCLEASLKDILEVGLSLIVDYSPETEPEVDLMIGIIKSRLAELRESDLVLFFRLLVFRVVHRNKANLQMLQQLIKEVDFRLSKYKKEPPVSILQSIAGIVKCSGICNSEDIPHITKLVNRLPSKPPSRKGQTLSISEKKIFDLLESNRFKIVASNPTLLNHYSVDLLLERKVCVEVNGYFHYTTSYIESISAAPSPSISAVHKIVPNTDMQRYRTPEAAKYLALLKNGYRIVTVDIKLFLTDPQKYQSEFISCLQSL